MEVVEQNHARLPRKPRRRLEERRGVSNVSDPERNFRPTSQGNLWDQVARNLAESITEKLGKKKVDVTLAGGKGSLDLTL